MKRKWGRDFGTNLNLAKGMVKRFGTKDLQYKFKTPFGNYAPAVEAAYNFALKAASKETQKEESNTGFYDHPKSKDYRVDRLFERELQDQFVSEQGQKDNFIKEFGDPDNMI